MALSRGEETVNNKTQTQGKPFLFLVNLCTKLKFKTYFKTYFVYFHTLSYKFKVRRTPTEFGLHVIPWRNLSRKLTMVSYPKPAKKYVSMIFFWLSTSQLPWVTFAASLNPHFGQKTKLSCSCCPHVEQNMASKEEGGAA